VAPHAQALLANSRIGDLVAQMGSEFNYVDDFVYANRNVTATALDGLGTAYYAPGIGEVYARSGWDKHATWVNLIAGPYTQSHAHQDQGSLMIYKDGWLAYDVVVDSHSGLPQETTAHSLVRIVDANNKTVEQQANYDLSKPDSKVVALHRGTGYLHVAADLTAAYGGQAIVRKVQREIVYLEPSTVIVYDRLDTASGKVVFQLVSPVATLSDPPLGTATRSRWSPATPSTSRTSSPRRARRRRCSTSRRATPPSSMAGSGSTRPARRAASTTFSTS
jgi:hypothetical protein